MSLKAIRFPRDDGIWVCCYAAENGYSSVLQWLRAQKHPCPWDESVCSAAAYNGNLSMLQWLRAQDPPSPWNDDVRILATLYGHLHVLEWLRAQNLPFSWSSMISDSNVDAVKAHLTHSENVKFTDHSFR